MSTGRYASIVLSLGSLSAQAASFTPQGDLPGGIFSSVSYDVSDSGGVVVGLGAGRSGTEAVYWLGGNFSSYAHSVSASGNSVVGWSGSSVSHWARLFCGRRRMGCNASSRYW
jgi:hypothetical protein